MLDNLWHTEVVLAQVKTSYTWKPRGITFQLTHMCDRILSFLLVALCLLASINDLFLHLHHQGIDILVTLHAIPPTIAWWWSEQLEDWTHPKSTGFLMTAVIFSSTECVSYICHHTIQQLQKQLQSLRVFQKDRLETVHHLPTLCNIWRH